jgi:hypothetical protein
VYAIENAPTRSDPELFTVSTYGQVSTTLLEYSGIAASDARDKVTYAMWSDSTANTGTTQATTQANELVVTAFFTKAGVYTFGPPTNGFTQLAQHQDLYGCGPISFAVYHKTVTTTGPQGHTASVSPNSGAYGPGVAVTWRAALVP